MQFSKFGNFFVVLIILTVLTTNVSFIVKDSKIIASVSDSLTQNAPNLPSGPQKLANPPEIIKGVYVTGWSAGSKKYLNYLSDLFDKTQINAVIVDVKDYSGLVSYSSGAPDVKKYNLFNNAIPDIDYLINFLHQKNIYAIARISVFEDPAYSNARPELAVYNKEKTTDLTKPVLWRDNNGLFWLDPASKDVWDYTISLAKDALAHGFDEINFDYVRFPSDGKTQNMGFPIFDGKNKKSQIIKEFFAYLRNNLIGEKISVDLFGQTTVNTDDMGIGQLIENAFENFDYVSPMIYPSHYINGFYGLENPAEHPYEVVKYSMDSAIMREENYSNALLQITDSGSSTVSLAKFRPWLQDFNMGANYNADMVDQEIKAVKDSLGSDYNGFMLWNPNNIYNAYQ